ncbi:14123_t:CDS:2, partial [Acaulospora morrowiae]
MQPDNGEIIYLENSTTNFSSFSPQQIVMPPFVGQVFETWDDVDKYFNDYAWQKNFVVIKIRNDRDPPPEQTCRRRIFACDHQGTYGPKKSVILKNQRNSRSKRSGCPWHINVTFPKKAAIISVKSLNLDHNHPLNPTTNLYAAKNRTLPEAILSGASAECFPEIDRILKEYLTEEMLSWQRHEVIQSLYYYIIMENNKLPNDKLIEEGYDTQQIHLSSLLEDLPQNDIIKIHK